MVQARGAATAERAPGVDADPARGGAARRSRPYGYGCCARLWLYLERSAPVGDAGTSGERADIAPAARSVCDRIQRVHHHAPKYPDPGCQHRRPGSALASGTSLIRGAHTS